MELQPWRCMRSELQHRRYEWTTLKMLQYARKLHPEYRQRNNVPLE